MTMAPWRPGWDGMKDLLILTYAAEIQIRKREAHLEPRKGLAPTDQEAAESSGGTALSSLLEVLVPRGDTPLSHSAVGKSGLAVCFF